MTLKEKLKETKHRLAQKLEFKARCRICHKTEHRRGMVFHHVFYVLGEKISKHFPSHLSGRIQYHEYLEPIIDERPEGFRYYCTACHITVSKIRQIKDDEQIIRLFQEVLATKWYSSKQMKEIFEAGLG